MKLVIDIHGETDPVVLEVEGTASKARTLISGFMQQGFNVNRGEIWVFFPPQAIKKYTLHVPKAERIDDGTTTYVAFDKGVR